MGRFFIAVGLSVLAVLGHYDVVVGDAVGDKIVVAVLILLPLMTFQGDA